MAKTTPGLGKALKAVSRLGKQMTREADADYAVGLSALAAGQQGLRRQTQKYTRSLVLGQRQNVLAVQALGERARQGQRDTAARQAGTTSRYGSALGQSVAQSYAGARAASQSAVKTTMAASRAAGKQEKVAGVVAGIAQAGVAAQQAAAEYSLNQALQQRAIIDNQTLAGLQGQLYTAAMQYNLEWAMFKKQSAFAQKQAEKAAGAAAAAEVGAIETAATEVSSWIGGYRQNLVTDAGGGEWWKNFDMAKAKTAWAESAGYASFEEAAADPALSGQALLFSSIMARAVASPDTNVGSVASDILLSLYGTRPGWDKYGETFLTAVKTGANAGQLRYFIEPGGNTAEFWANIGIGDAGPSAGTGVKGLGGFGAGG